MDIEIPGELTAYLRATHRVGPDEPLEIKNLAGGVSNRTVFVKRPSGEAWVLKQALAKLRVAVDWFSDPARVDREALGIDWLNRLIPGDRVPALVFHDPAHHLLAMQAVPQPHENFKTVLLNAPAPNPDHIRQFAELLAEVHANAWLRRAEIPPLFHDRQYFENLRLEPYYAYAAEQLETLTGATGIDVSRGKHFLQALIIATRVRLFTLVHGDYSPKNVLIYQGRLILLDHEVIHWGDPAFDIGFALTHLCSKAHRVAPLHKHFLNAARDFWRLYNARLLQLLPPATAPVSVLHSWRGYHQDRIADVMNAAMRDSRGVIQGTPMSILGAKPDTRWYTDLESYAVLHTLGCMLARVAGRSQLEYLTPEQKEHQRHVVLGALQRTPATINELIDYLADRL